MSEDVVRGGFWLFLDTIMLSLGGWIFWFTVSPLTTPAEVGYATTVIKLIALITGFLGLGLDYSLLKGISSLKGRMFGSAMAFEIVLLAIVSPLVLIVGMNIYGGVLNTYMTLGILLMLLYGVAFISRHTALGLLQSRFVFLFDSLGALARVIMGVWLVIQGLGGLGIVSASITSQVLISLGLMSFCYGRIGIGLGNWNEMKKLLKLGFSNLPRKISQMAINNLTIILLAAITSDPSIVGVFYIALAMSLLVGGLARSLATMALPVSTIQDSDLTSTSLTLGLCLTAPIISGLVTTPRFILSLVGEVYVAGSDSLMILALAMVPTTLVLNAVTKLNHQNKLRQLLTLGLTQLIVFLALFPSLASTFQSFGAALTVLISATVAGVLSSKWLGKYAFKPTAVALIAVATGWIIGTLLHQLPQPLVLISSLLTAMLVVFALKGLKLKEIMHLLKSIK